MDFNTPTFTDPWTGTPFHLREICSRQYYTACDPVRPGSLTFLNKVFSLLVHYRIFSPTMLQGICSPEDSLGEYCMKGWHIRWPLYMIFVLKLKTLIITQVIYSFLSKMFIIFCWSVSWTVNNRRGDNQFRIISLNFIPLCTRIFENSFDIYVI